MYLRLSLILSLIVGSISWQNRNEDSDFWMREGQHTLINRLNHKQNVGVAKNIVLFIGDGLGLPTITAARIYKGQLQGNPGEESVLTMDTFDDVGLSKTYNTDHQVSDSAGTATAMLYGFKTKYGVLGLDDSIKRGNCTSYTDRRQNFTGILHWAKEAGKSVGLVTNTRITHATPGALFAKSVDRNWEDNTFVPKDDTKSCTKDIAAQFVDGDGSMLDVIFGGGRRHFYPTTETDPEYPNKKGRRTDGRNIVTEWKSMQQKLGFKETYVYDKAGFDAIDVANTDKVLGLFDYSHMQYEALRNKDKLGEPSLVNMTRKAIQILKKNANGFFLLVEGGRIDHGHHESLGKLAILDTLQFDEAVDASLKMTNTKDTMTIVTADHSHVFDIGGYPTRGSPLFGLNDYENDRKENKPFTILMYTNGPGYAINNQGKRKNLSEADNLENLDYRQESGIDLIEETHGGEEVSIYAKGPMSWLLNGVVEQSYIAHAMSYAACIGPNKGHCDKKRKSYPSCTSDASSRIMSSFMVILVLVVQLF